MAQQPARRYQLERTQGYTDQLQRMLDNGGYPALQRSLPGVLFAIETRAELFAVVPECNLRAARSDGAGVEPPFSVWFDLDATRNVATLHGITYFPVQTTGLWDDD